ncbi:hypothetical protein FOC1_g10012624 [Fusarium oxysporum f. sp. cubense race 1]|uniref:Uncharacterized protein n=1 Tax=Fusarium oxysporum f. sp. cubense (strain race 1) TaxID=1229664 RepID=N4U0R9_FUSC1|nr:hypothetical protein FOC1_g10012624 [Fusarium oxysporum f. sp. cubense race 1]
MEPGLDSKVPKENLRGRDKAFITIRDSQSKLSSLKNAGIDPAIGDIYEACGIICANQDAVEARQVSDYNKSYARKITRHEIIKWMKAGANGEIVAKEEEDQLSGFLGMELFLQWPRAIF